MIRDYVCYLLWQPLTHSVWHVNRIGSTVSVYVDSYDPVVKKLVLSMAPLRSSRDPAQTEPQPPQKAKRGRPSGSKAADAERAALTQQQLQELAKTAPQRWIQAVVQNVTPFGLFVRPANYDVTGKLGDS